MAIKRADVVNVLKKCVDPEIGINIVDLGLLQSVNIADGNSVDVKVTMTSPMCPVTSIILADIQLRIQELPEIGNVNIDLVWDPMWTPEMISEEARLSMAA